MANTRDSLQQFVALRSALVRERDTIHKRLLEIDRALGGRETSPFARKEVVTRSKRLKNSMSLREAVTKAVGKTPLTKQEILSGVEKVGYRFGAKQPMRSLEVFLYTTGKKMLKRVDGKFAAR